MYKQLILLICIIPFLSGMDYNVAFNPRAVAAANKLTRFFAIMSSEPDTAWSVDRIGYQQPFSDNIGIRNSTQANERYDIVGADGELCNFTVSNKGGNFDAADSGAVATIRKISGGVVDGGTWVDTALSVTITTDDGTTDDHWTDTDCISVSRGDAVQIEWDTSATSTAWDSGDAENPKSYIEFRSTDADTFFTSILASNSSAFQDDFLASPLGASEIMFQDENFVAAPLPASFTATGISATFQDTPGTDTTVSLCEDDGVGDDASCGGLDQGTARFSCTVTTAQTTCGSTSCIGNCDFSAGERVFVGFDENEGSKQRAVAVRWTSATHQWFSGVNNAIDTANETEGGLNRAYGSTGCGQFVAEDPQCMIYLPRAATVKATRGYMNGTLAAGTIDVSPRETAVDAAVNCTFSNGGGTTCSETTDEIFDIGDWYSTQATPASTPSGGGDYSVTFLWDDLQAGD